MVDSCSNSKLRLSQLYYYYYFYRYSKIYNNAKSKLVSTRNLKPESRAIQTRYRTIVLLRQSTESPSEPTHPSSGTDFI